MTSTRKQPDSKTAMSHTKRKYSVSQNERLAILEERLAAHVESDREMFAALRKDASDIKDAVAKLVDTSSKQRGFLAGASFAWTAVWSALVLAVSTAISYLKS